MRQPPTDPKNAPASEWRGLLYLAPLATDMHSALHTTDTPLNSLGVKQLCQAAKALDKLNASLR